MKGFSLLEILLVLFIIATLSTLAVSHYQAERESMFDAEAQANLATLVAANRDYRRQQGAFYVSGNEADLNSNLAGVLIPTAANRPWDYSTQAGAATCCAQATRTGGPNVRTWRFCSSETVAVLGTCGGGASNCP